MTVPGSATVVEVGPTPLPATGSDPGHLPFPGQADPTAPGNAPGPDVGPKRVMYRVPVDPSTSSVDVEVRRANHNIPLNEDVALYDHSGRKVAEEFVGPQHESVSLKFVPNGHGLRFRPDFYVGVSAVGGSGSNQAMAPFILTITRQYFITSPGSAQFNGLIRTTSPASMVLLSAQGAHPQSLPQSIDDSESESEYIETASTVGQEIIPAPAATGPLPTRSATPLGGVLADGDPIPQIDRLEAAKVDLDLIVPSQPGGERVARADGIVDEPQDGPEGPLVAVRGPGGFPLLASGLGGVRSSGPVASIAFFPWSEAPIPARQAVPNGCRRPSAANPNPGRGPGAGRRRCPGCRSRWPWPSGSSCPTWSRPSSGASPPVSPPPAAARDRAGTGPDPRGHLASTGDRREDAAGQGHDAGEPVGFAGQAPGGREDDPDADRRPADGPVGGLLQVGPRLVPLAEPEERAGAAEVGLGVFGVVGQGVGPAVDGPVGPPEREQAAALGPWIVPPAPSRIARSKSASAARGRPRRTSRRPRSSQSRGSSGSSARPRATSSRASAIAPRWRRTRARIR